MVGNGPGDELARAAAEMLAPLIKQMLAANVPFGRLEAALRELFVDIADRDFALPDRPQSDSRIALLTGINRKEVRRIRSRDGAKPAPVKFGRNHAASLVSRWLTDPRATDRHGKPRPIPYQAKRAPSFVQLAREAAADLPPRAILDELLRTGAVRFDDGLVALQADSYVPALGRPEKLRMLADDPRELVETMLHNVFDGAVAPLLQRKVSYDNIGAEGMTQLRTEVRRAGEAFLRKMDGLLARHDRDRNPKAPGGERRRAGIGVYFFEGDASPGPVKRSSGGRKPAKRTAKERRK